MSSDKFALVVDDNPTNRLLACTLLKKMGWSVSDADCGETALVMAEQHRFRLILLDISMPGLSGEETCERLRTQAHGPDFFIVAYTAHAFPEQREHMMASGFDDVLIKPFARPQLEAILQKL